ncbi:RlpA-like double-psi beta-barrel domain-containing protein [Bacillus sp. UNCCL81]|uniref:RlpA-like double-psi beta-barrel domain-containing protein n=1 Tax=Bacillus sp. UNCCL81 TaxID=1502755 RepID=UPI0008E23443|nr:RlpA-like double-psi beta-barrel domain-containing protein [Bacillus sp. UNCCL81]SFD84598.1 Rare lipoprotein A (RlpA)-like double-psi beta-barrel [Bacillus sp. UNCCL81]
MSINGVASWHPGAGFTPMCQPWDNNKNLAAYPYVYKSGTGGGTCTTYGCGRASEFPKKNCGSTIAVYNPCTTSSVTVTIAECGPSMSGIRCGASAPRCQLSYLRDVIIDLSPAAFSALGDIDDGYLGVIITP